MKYCPNCGNEVPEGAQFCNKCGAAMNNAQQFNNQNMNQNGNMNQPGPTPVMMQNSQQQGPTGVEQKSKMAAGLLGIFLGGWGIHNFYLGYTNKAIIQIVVTLCTCGVGSLWGLIEGIMILSGSINTDAKGVPLKD